MSQVNSDCDSGGYRKNAEVAVSQDEQVKALPDIELDTAQLVDDDSDVEPNIQELKEQQQVEAGRLLAVYLCIIYLYLYLYRCQHMCMNIYIYIMYGPLYHMSPSHHFECSALLFSLSTFHQFDCSAAGCFFGGVTSVILTWTRQKGGWINFAFSPPTPPRFGRAGPLSNFA